MRMSDAFRTALPTLQSILAAIPNGQWFSLGDSTVEFQCYTQAEVQALRVCFPGAFWTKQYQESQQWWQYTTNVEGIPLKIYACREAPPTCRAIEETYEAVEQIPTAFEVRIVTKTRIRYECGPDTPESL